MTVPPGSGAVPEGGALATLRRFVREREPGERCELCSAPLRAHPRHEHLLEPADRQLLCACTPCALLFPADARRRYLRVPRDAWHLGALRLDSAAWDQLAIPVGLAFIHTTQVPAPAGAAGARGVRAWYPSPAGPTESLLTLEAWAQIVTRNPVLARMEPDVQALLIRRGRGVEEHYMTPIDACYELVGLIRASWRGLSGGTEVWRRVDDFFTALRGRSRERGVDDA